MESTCFFNEISSKNGVFFSPKIIKKWLKTCPKTKTKNVAFFDHILIDLGVHFGTLLGAFGGSWGENLGSKIDFFSVSLSRPLPGLILIDFWSILEPQKVDLGPLLGPCWRSGRRIWGAKSYTFYIFISRPLPRLIFIDFYRFLTLKWGLSWLLGHTFLRQLQLWRARALAPEAVRAKRSQQTIDLK